MLDQRSFNTAPCSPQARRYIIDRLAASPSPPHIDLLLFAESRSSLFEHTHHLQSISLLVLRRAVETAGENNQILGVNVYGGASNNLHWWQPVR
jgi:hypothetical protein